MPLSRGYCGSILCGIWSIALTAGAASAQSSAAFVSGVVRTVEGKAVAEAAVRAGNRMVRTDSLGRYSLEGLEAGQVRIVVLAIGFTRTERAITLHAGDRIQCDITLRQSGVWNELVRQQATADSQNASSGRIDSIALRLIRPTPDRALPLGAFGSRLFAALVAERGADFNMVMSPLSAGMALSLARFGARGATAAALDQVLSMRELDQPTIEQRGAQMMSDLLGRTDVTLEMANAIWVDTRVTPTPTFSASTARWHATTASLPLATSNAMEAINHWADSVTHKKIKTILSEPLDKMARRFIANAVYFKGKWLEPFDKSATQPGEFTLPSGKRITVPRMTRMANIGYQREPGFQTIRLPYSRRQDCDVHRAPGRWSVIRRGGSTPERWELGAVGAAHGCAPGARRPSALSFRA